MKGYISIEELFKIIDDWYYQWYGYDVCSEIIEEIKDKIKEKSNAN